MRFSPDDVEIEIEHLTEALGLDIDERSRLEEFTSSCRVLVSALSDVVVILSKTTRELQTTIDCSEFVPILVERGFPEHDAWSRMDDVEAVAGVPEIHDLLTLVIAIAERAQSGAENRSIELLAERLELNLGG